MTVIRGQEAWLYSVPPQPHKRGGYKPRSIAERFWPKVDVRGPDECWPWLASKNAKGYGKLGNPGKNNGYSLAPRVSWALAHGAMPPPSLLVCHSCDNPPCVNPAHLWLGTHADNLRDMRAKGRSAQQQRTHCPRGHEYSPENTYRLRGGRWCRECKRVASSEIRDRRRAA